jgi:hypothetical protein
MILKPIKQKTFDELKTLRDRKLDSKLEWLNHTDHAEAFEDCGRLYYKIKVAVRRNIADCYTITTELTDTGKAIVVKESEQ